MADVEELSDAELAYIAGILDVRGYLTTRIVNETELPSIAVMLKDSVIIDRLCRLTGVKAITIAKDYNRANCGEHCPLPHVHVVTSYRRWIVTGFKARVVLQACVPFMFAQRDLALKILDATSGAPFKPASVTKMRQAGWPPGVA